MTFYVKLAKAYINIEEFEKAKKCLDKAVALSPNNSINWFIVYEYYILFSFRVKAFSSTDTIIQSIYANKHLSRMPPQIQERWRIYEAYTQYLIAIKKLDGRKSRKFRLHKFLNEVPIYSRDKRGTNITILILHILFMLEQKDYSRIYDRIEALKLYHRRYLRHNDTLRSNCFIRMLVLLIETDFHRERMEHRAKRYLKKMQSRPIATASQSTELEIIPYPVLWQYVLDSLG